MMLNSRVGLLAKRINLNNYNSVSVLALYSRKSSSNHEDSFKIVGRKGTESNDEIENASLGLNPNWELLTPQGFRFYLPGNTGPAWQDVQTSANITNLTVDDRPALDCTVQDCPVLLRQGVYELFPGTEVFGQLTVVTLSQASKSQTGSKATTDFEETEELTKQFVLAAQDICHKLKLGGYWADFINPFSGLPFLSPAQRSKLYETDERFRCLGFRIFEKNQCRIIAERSTRNFIGSLFTAAPPNTEKLREILQEYEK